jgi:hypothetical protein
MKNLILILSLASISCVHTIKTKDQVILNSNLSTLVGHWDCDIIGGMYAEFDFDNDGNYEQRTYSFNNVKIGGHKGHFKIGKDRLVLFQEQEYALDNDTRKGSWYPQIDIVQLGMNIKDNDSVTLTISGFNLRLGRKK